MTTSYLSPSVLNIYRLNIWDHCKSLCNKMGQGYFMFYKKMYKTYTE